MDEYTMKTARNLHREEMLIDDQVADEEAPGPKGSRKRVRNYKSFRQWARANAASLKPASGKLSEILGN